MTTATTTNGKAATGHGRLILPPNLASLARLAGDATRYALSSVRLARTPDGYEAVATNGKLLGHVSGPNAADPETDYPDLPALAAAPNGATVALVPADSWTEAFRLVPKQKAHKPALRNLAAVLGEIETTFGATDLDRCRSLSTRNVEGRYPDFTQVYLSGPPRATVRVNADLLCDLLKVAAEFATDGAVTLELREGKNGTPVPVMVRAQNASGQQFTGVLVPLTPPAEAK
jgi:hypothetical protein